MAPTAISSGLEKLQQTLDGSIEGRKAADLAKDTRDYHDKNSVITTDYGVKQWNTGTLRCQWLIILRSHLKFTLY